MHPFNSMQAIEKLLICFDEGTSQFQPSIDNNPDEYGRTTAEK
jgi:hypothetical protein